MQEELANLAVMVGKAVQEYTAANGEAPGGIISSPAWIPEGYTEILGIPIIVSKWVPTDGLYLASQDDMAQWRALRVL